MFRRVFALYRRPTATSKALVARRGVLLLQLARSAPVLNFSRLYFTRSALLSSGHHERRPVDPPDIPSKPIPDAPHQSGRKMLDSLITELRDAVQSSKKEEVMRICETIKKEGVVSYDATRMKPVFDLLIENDYLPEFRVMANAVFDPADRTNDKVYTQLVLMYTHVIQMLGQNGYVEDMMNIFRKMKTNQIKRNIIIYTLLFGYVTDGGTKHIDWLDEVIRDQEDTKTPLNPISYATLIYFFAFHKLVDRALKYSKQLYEEEVAPGSPGYEALLFLYQLTEDGAAIKRCLEDMKKQQIELNARHYQHVLSGFLKTEDVEAFEKMFSQINIKKKLPLYNVAIEFYSKLKKDNAKVEELFAEMKDHFIKPIQETYFLMLRHYALTSNIAGIDKIFQEMKQEGLALESKVFRLLIQLTSQFKSSEFVQKIEKAGLPLMESAPTFFYNGLLLGYSSAMDWENFTRIFRSSLKANAIDGESLVLLCYGVILFNKESTLLDTALEQAKKLELTADPLLAASLLSANLVTQRIPQAAALFKTFPDNDNRLARYLVTQLHPTSVPEKVQSVLARLKVLFKDESKKTFTAEEAADFETLIQTLTAPETKAK